MKNQISKFFATGIIAFFSTFLYAQDGLDVDVDIGGNDAPSLFSNPYFWIGVAVVLIIITLITRIGKK